MILITLLCLAAAAFGKNIDDFRYHPLPKLVTKPRANSDELEQPFWNAKAQKILSDKLGQTLNKNTAKNVILFLGDGMSVPTLAATRAFQAERNSLRIGEGEPLSFEKFPFSGLSQTYCVDYSVADSACSATAYLCGVKGNEGTIGVNARVQVQDCKAMQNTSNHVDSIAQWFQDKGLATGIVTNTRVTHASPAGTYSHTANRDWENDNDVSKDDADPTKCRDIAYQLVNSSPGKNFNVILGGGRSNFLPSSAGGKRKDNLDLIAAWKTDKSTKSGPSAYVSSRDELFALDSTQTYLLGLFNTGHMDDHLKNNTAEPTLSEMTEIAIRTLQNTGKGFFLFVEGGRIDMAHHDNLAQISLDETVEFSKAVSKAKELTNSEDTLIVATADHAHTFSFAGYAARDDSIFSFGGDGDDDKPYLALSYANGPGFDLKKGERPDLSKDKTQSYDYVFPAGVPLDSETHGGDDVAVFADGPWAHLFTGSFEQNFIPHAMAYAACVGKGLTSCSKV